MHDITLNKTQLLRALRPGQQQGQTLEALADTLDVDPRDIPALVNDLQREGRLVVEDNGLYFIAATQEEWRAYRDQCLMASAVELAQRHRAMTRSAARAWPQQWRIPTGMIGEAA